MVTSVTNILTSARHNVSLVLGSTEKDQGVYVYKTLGWRKRSAVMQHFIQSLLSESHMMLNALRGVSQKVKAEDAVFWWCSGLCWILRS